MDVITYALFKSRISPEHGKAFNIQGIVASESELPMVGNANGDLYLVGPQGDNNYTEYYWLSKDNKWEFLGSADSDLTSYLKKDEASNIYGTKADVEELQEDNRLIYIN